MNKRKGISLIVLVITILVMIILAGVVVVSLQKNNPIEKAKTAKDTSNLSALKEELELYKTNELMQGNKDANNISFTETEVKDILKNIPDNLKGKVVVSNGKLGVYYSKITEEAQDYARENDIFNAEDKIIPDADVYTLVKGGKTFVRVDAIDYETDILSITCKENGNVFIPKYDFEKIAVVLDRSNGVFTNALKTKFKNVTSLELDGNFSDANIVVTFGAVYVGLTDLLEDKIVEKFKTTTKDKPMFFVTAGNDSHAQNGQNPLISLNSHVTTKVNISPKLVDNIVTRKIEEHAKKVDYFRLDDSRYAIEFKQSPYIERYFNNIGESTVNGDTAMYLNRDKGQGWMHMQSNGSATNSINNIEVVNIYKAAITKMTGSRSMEFEALSGTYTFEIKDLAGNTLTKTITI